MIIRKKIIISFCLLFVLFLSTSIFFFDTKDNVIAQTINYDFEEIGEKYKLNEKIVFPREPEILINSKSIKATNGVVISPNGEIFSITNNGIILSSLGEYSVEYFYLDENKNAFNVIDNFTVINDLYYFTIDNGSEVIYVENDDSFCDTNATNYLFSQEDGLIVRLNNGSNFVYSKPIDLSTGTNGEFKEIIAFDPKLKDVEFDSQTDKFVVKSDIADELIIQLTDCYNPLNYVQIITNAIGDTIYFRAKTSKSSRTYGILYKLPTNTLKNLNNLELFVDGKRGIAYFDEWGTYFTGYGATGKASTQNNIFYDGLSLSFDYDKQRIYYEYNGEKTLICDFLNSILFSENERVSFTTGEVYFSMWGKDYTSNKPVRVDITSLGGEKVSNNIDYVDTMSPKLSVKDGINTLHIAKGEKFIVPKIDILDVNYIDNISVNVYRNYNTEYESLVASNCKEFTPNLVDTYSIVYCAKDTYGNSSTFVLDLVSEESNKTLSIETLTPSSLKYGSFNVLPSYSIFSLNKHLNCEVKITAIFEEKEYDIDPTSLTFMPQDLGEYTIKYEYNDGFFFGEYSYTVNSISDNDVVFIGQPVLEKYYIKNLNYGLSPIKTYKQDKISGKYNLVVPDLYISFDDCDFSKVDYLSFNILGDNIIKFKFVVDEYSSEVFESIIKDISYGSEDYKYSNNFFGDFTPITEDDGYKLDYTSFISNKNKGTNSLSFINKVSFSNFRFEYKLPIGKENFTKLNLKLLDYKDSSKQYIISIRNQNGNAFISFNHGEEFLLVAPFSGTTNTLAYNDNNKIITFNGNKYVADLGFDNNFVYIEIEMEEIYGASAISICRINNNPFISSKFERDSSQPIVDIYKCTGEYSLNTIVSIQSPIFSDVLSSVPLSTVKFNVKMPDGTYAIDENGTTLNLSGILSKDYMLKLTQFGKYTVSFECSDESSAIKKESYTFEVVDTIAPEIILQKEFNSNTKIEVNVGKLTLKYDVSDDITSKDNIFVQVNLMNEKTMVIKSNVGNSFYIAEKGNYKIIIYALDEKGNSTKKSVSIVVI